LRSKHTACTVALRNTGQGIEPVDRAPLERFLMAAPDAK
jgi:hypothetical protein